MQDVSTPPAPIDLTGGVTAQIRQGRADTYALADFAVDLANAATGVVILTLTGVQTDALMGEADQFRGVYDVEWTPAGSEPVTLVQGGVTCDRDVTRPPEAEVAGAAAK